MESNGSGHRPSVDPSRHTRSAWVIPMGLCARDGLGARCGGGRVRMAVHGSNVLNSTSQEEIYIDGRSPV